MKRSRIITGECVKIMSKLPDECIDLTITSPPYDNLRKYNGYTFDFSSIATQLYRITKIGGVVVWVVGDASVDGSETGTSFRQALGFMEKGFRLHDTMIWNKKSFTFPQPNRYHGVFEYMFVFSKDKPKTFNPISDRLNASYGKNFIYGKRSERKKDGTMIDRAVPNKAYNKYGRRFNIWELNNASQEAPCTSRKHPAQMAYKVAHDHILSWSNPGDWVLDPMCGSGTTCKAAKDLGRKYVGIDISAEYTKLARERLR